jgi:hypothetical protein
LRLADEQFLHPRLVIEGLAGLRLIIGEGFLQNAGLKRISLGTGSPRSGLKRNQRESSPTHWPLASSFVASISQRA